MNKLTIEPVLKDIPFLKDAPARALKAVERDASWYSLSAGWPLFHAGDAPDAIYFVLTGSLGAFRTGPDGKSELVGHIRSGEPVGEMAMFAAEPHTASVYALRDTEVLRISRAGFQKLVKAEPEILQRLIRIILMRTREQSRRTPRSEPKVFALIATSPTIDMELRAKALQAALQRRGCKVVIIGEDEGDEKPAHFFDRLEAQNDLVLLHARVSDSAWYRLAMRQADRIWVFARSDARPSVPLLPEDPSPARQFRLIDVVLLHHGSRPNAAPTSDWITATQATRVFHWHRMDEHDCDRLSRFASGRSVGLVLSGGGARAYAQIGVVKALREARVPIDVVGGTSMGAVIAACVAMGWDDAEIDWRIRKAFVESNPLGDYNLPVVGLVKGRRVKLRLEEHFGNTLIEDLKLPFFAVSTNLTDAAVRIHRQGVLRHALRASISLPGILPPVVDDGEVLVDGAVMNNFPVDVMREAHRGLIIGCDVARESEGLNDTEFINPPGFFGWVFRNGFNAAPPIADLLMRAATITVNPHAGRELANLLIAPEMHDVTLRSWDLYDLAVEEGYQATRAAIAASTVQFPRFRAPAR